METMGIFQAQQIPNVQIGLLTKLDRNENNSISSTATIPYSYLDYIQEAAKFLGFNFGRTVSCKHRGMCFTSILASSTRLGVIAYLIKSCISMVFSIRKILRDKSQVISAFTSKDNVKFGLFLCAILFLIHTIVCGLRRILKQNHEKYIYLIAGLIGGTASAFILGKKTRQAIGLFLFVRALDFTYRSLVQKKIIKEFKYIYHVSYHVSCFIQAGLYCCQPFIISQDLYRFYLKMLNQPEGDSQLRRIWIQKRNNWLYETKGIPKYNALDYCPRAKQAYLRQVVGKK